MYSLQVALLRARYRPSGAAFVKLRLDARTPHQILNYDYLYTLCKSHYWCACMLLSTRYRSSGATSVMLRIRQP